MQERRSVLEFMVHVWICSCVGEEDNDVVAVASHLRVAAWN